MKKISALLTSLAVACGLLACKEDEPGLESGLPADKKGAELTPAEQQQYCDAADAFAAEVLPPAEIKAGLCTLSAILGSLTMFDGSVDACNTLRTGCLDAPSDATYDTCSGFDWTTCDATIAELEACHEEYAAQTSAGFAALQCEKMDEYKADNPGDDTPALGEACSRAQAKCPSAVGGGVTQG